MPSVPPPQLTSTGPPAPPQPPEPPSEEHPEDVPWPLWTAPAAVAIGLVAGVFGSIIVAAIGGEAGSTHTSPAVSLISDVVFDGAFVATALYFASVRRRPEPWQFGYRRIAPAVGIGAFVVGAV